MDVQLASELDPAAEAERLRQWAAGYHTSGGLGGWLAPRRAAGERWQVVIRAALRAEIDQRALADPGRLIGHRRVRHPPTSAWMSPQRVIFANGRAVVAAWRLDELFDVRVLDDLTGVVLLAAEPRGRSRRRRPVPGAAVRHRAVVVAIRRDAPARLRPAPGRPGLAEVRGCLRRPARSPRRVGPRLAVPAVPHRAPSPGRPGPVGALSLPAAAAYTVGKLAVHFAYWAK